MAETWVPQSGSLYLYAYTPAGDTLALQIAPMTGSWGGGLLWVRELMWQMDTGKQAQDSEGEV